MIKVATMLLSIHKQNQTHTHTVLKLNSIGILVAKCKFTEKCLFMWQHENFRSVAIDI